MKKIQTKIIVMVVLAVLSVSMIAGTMGTLVTRYSTTSALEKNLLETAELAALAAENMISTYTLTISEMASHPILVDENISAEEKQAYIQEKADAYYMRFGGMADTNGYDVIHESDISGEPFFQAAVQGNSYMSTPYIDGSDIYLMVAAPIRDGEDVKGVLYFQCDTYILQSIIEGLQIGEEGEAYILDKEGTTIAYVDQEAVMSRENVMQQAAADPGDEGLQTVAAIEKRMVAGEVGVERFFYAEDQSNNIQSYAPISGTDGWSIAVTIDEADFMRPADYGNLFQIIICVAVCIIVIAISLKVSHSIAAPVVKCANRLLTLSQGDLKSPVPQVKGRDETRILADSTAKLVKEFGGIVYEIEGVLGAIADGDLSKEVSGQCYPGDFAVLWESLRVISDKLNSTMAGIISASGCVSTGSDQVAATASVLSQGAMEQTGAVEELSGTISSMSTEAKGIAQLTGQAKDVVNGAGGKLQESGEYIDSLNQAMNQITESSSEISRIIDTIENIAFQTNILAINASVEAARAGTGGKGFAVVAEEVRNLAIRSDQAAKATQELIGRSVKAVEDGSLVVGKVTDSVTTAVEFAGQAVERMEQVAKAVEDQTDAIEQVAAGIEQISGVVQNNSATAQESAATSQELSGQAEMLKQLVGSFRLKR
ncbi:MAG: HAMP domain-containing protein [Lachnospiraceae bacterium]|nr:HAMP domain-containing protein [Lachnospiraceae bacterium]